MEWDQTTEEMELKAKLERKHKRSLWYLPHNQRHCFFHRRTHLCRHGLELRRSHEMGLWRDGVVELRKLRSVSQSPISAF